jgi:Ca2+-binding EF-hand superfamily protein
MTGKTTWWFVAGLLLTVTWAPRDAAAQDPSEFLRRLDTNNDGMLDKAELEGRAGGFILRMAENNPRLDFSRPVPISRLSEEFTRMREERMQSMQSSGGPGGGPGGGFPGRGGPPGGWTPGGGPPGGGPPGAWGPGGGGPPGRGGDDQGRDRGRGDEQNNPYRRPESTAAKPLVPGFGEEEVVAPPLGFGAEGELFSVQINEQDRQEAARAFRYYDRNNDGKIDQEELRRSSRGDDLMQYDRNRDGAITPDEMEYRYAQRRVANTRGTAPGMQQPSEGGDRRGRGGRDGGEGRSNDNDNGNPSPYASLSSYRVVAPVERLPEGLPDWFYRNDADGDGQISMVEFSATWTEAVLQEFLQFDLNQDGLVTPEEALRAQADGAARGMMVSAAASAAPPTNTNGAAASSGEASSGEPSAEGSAAASGPPIDPRYMDYYKKLVAKYDTSGDGVLTADEWVNMSRNPVEADVNKDGKITVEEFARWSMKR